MEWPVALALVLLCAPATFDTLENDIICILECNKFLVRSRLTFAFVGVIKPSLLVVLFDHLFGSR